jgi:HSP20 family protein
MALVRYNSWQEMSSLQRQLNRLFDSSLTFDNLGDFSNLSKVPAAELTQTEDALHLKLEVPGMEAQDLDIQVMADRVAISGERKSETKTEENGKTREDEMFEEVANFEETSKSRDRRVSSNISAVRSEFRYGKFSRVIPLPVKIQNNLVTADYQNGILSLTLPKAESEKNKVVKINLGETTV